MIDDLITDLDQIAALAAQRADEFDVLRYQLQLDDVIDDAKLDAWVDQLAAPIVAAIDCTRCANCCRALQVGLDHADVERLADGLGLPVAVVLEHFVERDVDDEWGVFRARPCALLDGNLCSVYAHRPAVCRLYPQFTPDFRWTLEQMAGGAGLCPIVYHVLNAALAREKEIYAL